MIKYPIKMWNELEKNEFLSKWAKSLILPFPLFFSMITDDELRNKLLSILGSNQTRTAYRSMTASE